MPTAYTNQIIEGDGVDLRTFMLSCVRAMGVLVTMRDEPFDAPIPKELVEASTYYIDALDRAKAEHARLTAMSSAEMEAEIEKVYLRLCTSWEEMRAKAAKDKTRYEDMLAQVNAWTPPTEEHRGFKAFMVAQLTESIKTDCESALECPAPKRPSTTAVRHTDLRSAQGDVDYYTRKLAAARLREGEDGAWLKAFWGSLPPPEEPVVADAAKSTDHRKSTLDELNGIYAQIRALETRQRAIYAESLSAPESEKVTQDFVAKSLSGPSRRLRYPLKVNGIGFDTAQSVQKPLGCPPMTWVAVRPCDGDAEDTYLGILLGDIALGVRCSHLETTGILTVGPGMLNPCMWVPDLERYVYGAGSWWRKIDGPDALAKITTADINGAWYMRALAELSEG